MLFPFPLLLLPPFLFLATFGPAQARNAPPQLLPLEGQQSPIRIALGTRNFKLSCPVRMNSEEGRREGGGKEEEDGQEGEELIIKWTKDGQPVEGDDRFRLAQGERDLRIRLAQPGDSGLYKCTAINEWGHRNVEFRLEVVDARALAAAEGLKLAESASPPAWKEPLGPQPLSVRVQSGQSLQLRCPPANANPLPQITWIRLGQQDQELGSSALLSLNQVRPQDAGVYTCRLENPLGSIRADFSVQVTEEFDIGSNAVEEAILLNPAGSLSSPSGSLPAQPPQPPHIEQPQKLRAGNIAQLQCRVEWRGERDKALIRWLRQVDNSNVEAIRARTANATLLRLGEITLLMLDQGNDAVRLEADPGGQRQYFLNELRIGNVQKEDSGRYFCVVTNPAGQFVYRSAVLSVVDPPPAFLPFPTSPAIRLLLLSSFGLLLCCFPLICWLLFIRRCRSTQQSADKCPHPPPPPSSSANTSTFASSSSSSSTNSATKQPLLEAPFGQQQQLPPPPRHPPPILPQSASYQQSTFWSAQFSTMARPQMLHRTRAEDEMSRMSSHIYASGSPLPPFHHSPPVYPGTTLLYPSHQQRFPAEGQMAALPSNPSATRFGGRMERRGVGDGGRMEAGEEQKMPLIEAQRQSAELWRGE